MFNNNYILLIDNLDKNNNINNINNINFFEHNKIYDNFIINIFDFYLSNIYKSPYLYYKIIKKNITYNKFVYYIHKLITYPNYDFETKHLKKKYGICKINNISLNKIIINSNYKKLIYILIINKRIEYLYEYITDNNFEKKYISYIDNIINILYKNTKYLINIIIPH